MLTALAATTTTVTMEISDWTPISALILPVKGMASVGLKAEALVSDT